MISRKNSNHLRRGSPRALGVWVLALGLLVLCAGVALWRVQLAGFFWDIAAPLLSVRNSVGSSDIARLQAALASTTAALADRNLLYKENLELKARLGRNGSVETILAGVVARPPAMPYDILMIDAGVQQGVVEGDLVSAGGTVLVGRVEQVYKATARVVLFSAPGQTYKALLGGTIPVEVEGQGGGSLVAQVPAKIAARVGDAVVFPGIAGGFSSVVSYVEARDGESFEKLYMRLPVDPLTLRWVEVWKQKNATQ